MTHSIQKSFFTSGRLYNKRYYPGNFYQVVINTEDGESYEYEIVHGHHLYRDLQ